MTGVQIYIKNCFKSSSQIAMARCEKCIQLSPEFVPWILGSDTKSMDAQVPYIKWHSICIHPTHILPYTLNHLWITYNTNTV